MLLYRFIVAYSISSCVRRLRAILLTNNCLLISSNVLMTFYEVLADISKNIANCCFSIHSLPYSDYTSLLHRIQITIKRGLSGCLWGRTKLINQYFLWLLPTILPNSRMTCDCMKLLLLYDVINKYHHSWFTVEGVHQWTECLLTSSIPDLQTNADVVINFYYLWVVLNT